jgi:hypothetical protein
MCVSPIDFLPLRNWFKVPQPQANTLARAAAILAGLRSPLAARRPMKHGEKMAVDKFRY